MHSDEARLNMRLKEPVDVVAFLGVGSRGVLIIASLGCTIPRRTPRTLADRSLRSRRELE